MGRDSTSPITIEDCAILSCKNLKDWGYLASNTYSYQSGSIKYSRGGYKCGSFGIVVCNTSSASYVEFSYTITSNYEGKEPLKIKYRVPLVKVPTNIGNSYRFYFLCPHTGKKCSKLYKPPHEHYFLNRAAFPYLFYQNQIESSFSRLINHPNVSWNILSRIEEIQKELNQKYKKHYYKGKPTKLMQKYLYLCSQYKSNNDYTLMQLLD